ncbi:putative mitochondrial dicarboxylate [Phaeomoniella chlamydospora]|uniref:Putative mitochondrial dicarboxylate n=1 Tax=Phaeomoniella chlamydospora TaxID=158046 RepID=A0A0G2E414_PHACM|nr:putative mitochondrial dicarboxylate [Phaeomoniella chlamydospora]
MFGTFVHVAKTQGIFGLYNGLSAALLRQLTYSTVRFGVYEELKSAYPSATSLPALIAMSSASGLLGGIAGNPGDVLNVRMQSDFAKPVSQRRNYKHALDGLIRMAREEGIVSLFKGVVPNSARAILMTSSQLASYDAFKRLCIDKLNMSDNPTTHLVSSLSAGFVATTVCSPVDVIKTRVMSASAAEGGHGLPVLLKNIYAKEGLTWMFRGWVPSFIRLGPHTIFTFLFLEQHKHVYRWLKGI